MTGRSSCPAFSAWFFSAGSGAAYIKRTPGPAQTRRALLSRSTSLIVSVGANYGENVKEKRKGPEEFLEDRVRGSVAGSKTPMASARFAALPTANAGGQRGDREQDQC